MPAIRLRPRTVLVLFNLFAFLGAFILQQPGPFLARAAHSNFTLPVFAGSCLSAALLLAGFVNWFFFCFIVKANEFDLDEYGLLMKEVAIVSGGVLLFLYVAEEQPEPVQLIRYFSAVKAPAWIDLVLGSICCVTLAILRRFTKRALAEEDSSENWGKQWTPNDD